MENDLRKWIRLVENTNWNQRYIVIDPSGADHSPSPDTNLRTIFSTMGIEHFGVRLEQGWVLASITRDPPQIKIHIGKNAPAIAVKRCLDDLVAVGYPTATLADVAAPQASAKLKLADIMEWMATASAPKKVARKRLSLPQRVAEDQASILDSDVSGTKFERVVWARDKIIECNELSDVGFQNVQGVFGLHVGDPDFWFSQIVNDYGRDADAWVIEIIGRAGDVLVEDEQYAIPPEAGEKGFSGVLFTARKQLIEGKDFVYTRRLTEDDLADG